MTDHITFKEFLSNTYDLSFMTEDEKQTLYEAGELYTQACVKRAVAALPVNEWNAEELWDEFSELIGDDIDSLSCVAGSDVMRRSDYFKMMARIGIWNPQPPTK